jgi:hypothetical protein
MVLFGGCFEYSPPSKFNLCPKNGGSCFDPFFSFLDPFFWGSFVFYREGRIILVTVINNLNIILYYIYTYTAMSLNVEDLLKALDNENNTGIAGLTTTKIKKEKNDILQKLQLSGKELKDLHTRLKDYRYINELNDIQMGRYIRWIPLNTETAEIKLTKGAFMVNTFLNEDGACLLCRNTYRRPIVVKFDKVLIFQKLSEQEQILISAIDFLDKK